MGQNDDHIGHVAREILKGGRIFECMHDSVIADT